MDGENQLIGSLCKKNVSINTTSGLEFSAGITIAGDVMAANPANSLLLLFRSPAEPSAVVFAEKNVPVHVNPCSKPLGDLATVTALADRW